jgi:death on curing protein
VDGNKRTGYTLMRLFLIQMGYDITASQDEKYQFIVKAASGSIKYDEIVLWLKSNVKKKSSGY